jgi:hypothetical protein
MKFSKIKSYKNIHQGERCFIIGNGPSLTYKDLDLLKDEICFGSNSLIQGFHQTDWRPVYYGIQDRFAYEELQDKICSEEKVRIFVADVIKKRGYKTSSNMIEFPISRYKHYAFLSKVKYSTKFSENPSAMVYDGYSITYSLLQIAVYMGFKYIYLLGCDCDYSAEPRQRHFIETKRIDQTPPFILSERMIFAYKKAKIYAEKNHINIYNATRGGKLEVFDRVNLEDILLDRK